MKIILLAIYFPPLSNSAAIQLGDLSDALKDDFSEVLIITPSSSKTSIVKEGNLRIFKVNYPSFLNLGLFKRGILEILLPFILYINLRLSKIKIEKYESVIWWSPSIFQVTFIHLLKVHNRNIKSILILRDIFPQWMIDLGGLKNKFLIYLFRYFENYQNRMADVISIQSQCNKSYFKKFNKSIMLKIRILPNWIKYREIEDNLYISNVFKDLKIYQTIGIYTGNIGLAQGLSYFKKLIESIKNSKKVCLVFIGRGSFYSELKNWSQKLKINNIIFLGEFQSKYMPMIYESADFGLIVLDPRHTTNNIPGKYISYINYGLPVLALVNESNSLIEEINKNNLGYANYEQPDLDKKIFHFFYNVENDKFQTEKIKTFAYNKYNYKKASKTIKNFLIKQ